MSVERHIGRTWVPKVGSRWVWEIDEVRARAVVEVMAARWNGEEWWIKTRTLPEAPSPMFADLTTVTEHLNELDRFREATTPVGGRTEDLTEWLPDAEGL